MLYNNATTNEYSISECQPIIPMVLEKPIKWKSSHIEVAPNCPRCASSKTKFCYYNNYSLSQPRYFCKACRRYWTRGGSLRNVPVGGGCRKRSRVRSVVRQGDTTNPHAGSNHESENPVDIDLAAVFANYVNPNHEVENSSGSTRNEDLSPMDFANGDEDKLQELLPQLSIHEEVSDQDLFYHDSVSFELQGVLDELEKELEGTNLPNFGCQPSMEQFQGTGLFPVEDHMRFPANLMNDGWDSFDLSAYGTFSGP